MTTVLGSIPSGSCFFPGAADWNRASRKSSGLQVIEGWLMVSGAAHGVGVLGSNPRVDKAFFQVALAVWRG